MRRQLRRLLPGQSASSPLVLERRTPQPKEIPLFKRGAGGGREDGTLDLVLELTDVARPVQLGESAERGEANAADMTVQSARGAVEKRRDDLRKVAHPVA